MIISEKGRCVTAGRDGGRGKMTDVAKQNRLMTKLRLEGNTGSTLIDKQ